MEKQKLLQELNELLNIPQIERLIAHKMEELKNIYKDEIDIYSSLQENYRKNLYGRLHVCEESDDREITDSKNILKTYSFELDKDLNNKWNVSEIEPALTYEQNIEDIIPPLIIKYITNFNTNPTKIETVTHFSHPKLKGKKYNIRFTKYSEYHLLGTIAEVQNSFEEKTSPKTRGLDNLVFINDGYKNENEEMNYKELMYYLEKYPAFREHTFSEFFMKWKPLIDGQLLKLENDS